MSSSGAGTRLGIDIGTSAVKAILVDDAETVLAEAEVPLEVSRPQPGWSEQDPDDWWRAVKRAFSQVRGEAPQAFGAIDAIGLSGQMHAALGLDADGAPVGPAMLWNDGRATAECTELNETVADLGLKAGVPAMPGFTVPKLLWLARHDPERFARIRTIVLAKDYVRMKLTGEIATDMSDAAGALLLDEARRAYFPALVEACGLDLDQLPPLKEGSTAAGGLRRGVATAHGLTQGIVVATGGGDAAVGAVGIGAVGDGDAFLSLGTSAQYFVTTAAYRPYPQALVHAFAHAVPERWFQMAAMLNGASALGWLAGVVGRGDDIPGLLAAAEARGRRPSPVTFLPYLTGERTPHDNADARGVFFGLGSDTDTADLVGAVLEGVAFSLVDAQDAVAAAGTIPARLAAIGGGARSRLWLEIIASALGRPIDIQAGAAKGPAFGAARLARIARDGGTVAESCPAPAIAATIEPDPVRAAAYAERLPLYRALYRNLKPLFPPAGSPG